MDTITTTKNLLMCNGSAQPVMVALTRNEAHLIAAAPDLLAVAECEEALELRLAWSEVRAILERHGWGREDRHESARDFIRRIRRAAIAKAQGGES